MSAYAKCLDVITKVSAAIEAGEDVLWEARQKELRFVWTNTRTNEWWHIQLLSTVKRLSSTDPRTRLIIDFCQGTRNATETLYAINSMDNLKAFW